MSHAKRIRQIFDYAYANSALKTPSRICREVGKVLHVGMYREEVGGVSAGFTFKRRELNLLDGSGGGEVERIAAEIRSDFESMNAHWSLYPEKEALDLSAEELAYVAGQLDHLHISNPDVDIFGDALEIFRSKWAKQQVGQFFTNQYVTNLAVDLLEFNPREGDDFVDICAGTGGFLLAALNRIELAYANGHLDEANVAMVAGASLRGFEIDREIAELGNSTLSARLGRYGEALITCMDSIATAADNPFYDGPDGGYRCMATNPPFGAKVAIRNKQVLKNFELAHLSNRGQASPGVNYPRAPDTLFIERNVKLLEPGVGRVAIVIPYQILSGPQTRYIRDWILRNAYVEAVVDLPPHTFQPHTGTKTALVLLRRRSRPLLHLSDIEEYRVFVARPRSIGHDRRGTPVYCANPTGKETIDTDLPEIAVAFQEFRSGSGDPKLVTDRAAVITGREFAADPGLRLNARFHFPEVGASYSSISSSNTGKVYWEKLSSLVDDVFFPGRFKRAYVEKGEESVPFFGGTNITQWIVETDKFLRLDDPKLEKLKVQPGWILITRSGTTGVVSMVPQAWDGFAFSEHVIRIVPDHYKVSANYLHAVLKSARVQNQLARAVFGSVIDEITTEAVLDLDIPLPTSLSDYQDIVDRLDAAEEARNKFLVTHYNTVGELEDLVDI